MMPSDGCSAAQIHPAQILIKTHVARHVLQQARGILIFILEVKKFSSFYNN